MIYDALIVGAGPSGITCGINLLNVGKKVAIIERSTPGGKVNIAPRVDNYPGFKQIPGPLLAVEFAKRMTDSGIEVIADNVIELTKKDDLFTLKCEFGTYTSKVVFLGSGTKERKVGLEHEEEMIGHGISYCAVCDGHFYKNKDIAVVGGGNSALKEALYLSNMVNKIYLIHRRNEFRGDAKIVNEIKETKNIEILTPYIPVEILCDSKVVGLKIQNRETGEIETLNVEGFFPLVGQDPNTEFVHIDGVLNEWKGVTVDSSNMSNCPGLFAGGDLLPREIRSIYISEFDGKKAAQNIIKYLENE